MRKQCIPGRLSQRPGIEAMAISIVATFWLNFMIKNTYKIILQNNTKECRNGIDCFFDNSSRIPDFCDVDSVNLRIQCYHFDFINGAGTAGGVLAIAITTLYGQLTAQMWLKKNISKSESKQKIRRGVSKLCLIYSRICTYSRLSLFRLSEVRPPRYTGHLAWHGMLAICLLHKTHPEVRPLAIPLTGQCWLSQTRFSM